MGYDEWLQEPFQRMCAEADAYTDWCEAEGLDPDDAASEDAYNDFMADQYYDDDWEDYEDEYDFE